MSHQVKVPAMGESISEATISKLSVKVGDIIRKDDTIAELETEKVNLVISAPVGGSIKSISVKEGDEVTIDQLICEIDENASQVADKKEVTETKATENAKPADNHDAKRVSPAASSIADMNNIDVKKIDGSGPNGMVIKSDVIGKENKETNSQSTQGQTFVSNEETHSVKMSALRRTIARRLKDAQNTAAILTTFNEVDMSAVMELRKKYQEDFQKKYGVKLGFMSIFAKAASLALQEIPAVNAQIEGDNIIYKNYCHIGVAIGSEKGLVVPVIRHCDKISFSDIEKEILNYVGKANKGLLVPADFAGGTFTISNGGTYGSMMSTPIINPPQSAILGMHSITERAVVVNGQIVIRPMMYLALSYDHRIIDGSEAVRFLVKIKNYVENPQRMLLSC